MTLACGFVYVCAGFNYQNSDELMKSCERYSLLNDRWEHNTVPDLPQPMVAPTVITIDKIYIYSFGDNSNTYIEDSDDN